MKKKKLENLCRYCSVPLSAEEYVRLDGACHACAPRHEGVQPDPKRIYRQYKAMKFN